MSEAQVHLTLKRAAQALGVHEQTLRSWEKRGLIRMIRLPGSRYRRVPVAEVERLKREMAAPSATADAQLITANRNSVAPEKFQTPADAARTGLADAETFAQGAYAPKARVIAVREPPTLYDLPFDETVLSQGPVLLERDGRPVAALISSDEYLAFQTWRERQTWNQEELASLQPEREAFQRLLPELLETRAGQYVAIHDDRVVDSDPNEGELAWRVIARGLTPVYIGEVRPTPRVYHVPSLEVIHHVSL